ncbi:unnamed protein product [Closterium sp. NIES-53]
MTQDCGNPSMLLWQSLRRTHLLHPRGLPLFRPDWSYQPPQPLSPQQAQALPPDWVVVLAKRLSKKRSISNFNEVQAVVERAFPKERIVLFTGSLTVLEGTIVSFVMILSLGNALFFKDVQVQRAFPKERIVLFTASLTVLEVLQPPLPRLLPHLPPPSHALSPLPSPALPALVCPLAARNLFRRTRLFIAGHGAALTNLVFMPERASVLEIRPGNCAVVCYNHLSHACSLTYHLVFSHGGCLDTVQANATVVADALKDIKSRFDREDAEGI